VNTKNGNKMELFLSYKNFYKDYGSVIKFGKPLKALELIEMRLKETD
jgi:uncharacterized protein YqgQ